MNFQELMDAVALESGYGHLTDIIEHCCKAALSKLHRVENYQQDLLQPAAVATPSDLKFSLSIPSGFRSFESVKINFADSSYAYLPYHSLSWIRENPYASDYYTLVGSSVSFNLSIPATSVEYIYYADPVPTAPYSSWTDWMLTQHGDAVRAEAVALVFEAVELFDRAQITRQSNGAFFARLQIAGYHPGMFEAIGEE